MTHSKSTVLQCLTIIKYTYAKSPFFFAETSEIKQFEKWEKINRYIIKDYYIKLIFN